MYTNIVRSLQQQPPFFFVSSVFFLASNSLFLVKRTLASGLNSCMPSTLIAPLWFTRLFAGAVAFFTDWRSVIPTDGTAKVNLIHCRSDRVLTLRNVGESFLDVEPGFGTGVNVLDSDGAGIR